MPLATQQVINSRGFLPTWACLRLVGICIGIFWENCSDRLVTLQCGQKSFRDSPQNAERTIQVLEFFGTICPEYFFSSVPVVKLLVQRGFLVHILMLPARRWLPMMTCGRSPCWCLAVLVCIIANTVHGLGLFKWPTGREYHMIPPNRVIIWQASFYDQAKHTIV